MSNNHTEKTPEPRPLTGKLLKLGLALWGIAVLLVTALPGWTVLLIEKQYVGLITNGNKIADFLEMVDRTQTVHKYTDTAQEIMEVAEYRISDIPLAITLPLLIIYLIFAAINICVFSLISRTTANGNRGSRIVGTLLAVITTTIAITTWLTLANIAWVPIKAISLNNLNIAIICACLIGCILVWLPKSTLYMKKRRDSKLSNS